MASYMDHMNESNEFLHECNYKISLSDFRSVYSVKTNINFSHKSIHWFLFIVIEKHLKQILINKNKNSLQKFVIQTYSTVILILYYLFYNFITGFQCQSIVYL